MCTIFIQFFYDISHGTKTKLKINEMSFTSIKIQHLNRIIQPREIIKRSNSTENRELTDIQVNKTNRRLRFTVHLCIKSTKDSWTKQLKGQQIFLLP